VEDVDLGVCRGRWYAGDPDRVVVILPGAQYLPFAPLLWFAREVATSRGWSVLEVWDEYLDRSVDPWQWVAERAEAALGRAGDAQKVLVTKSITSRAVTIAAEKGLPGIWLTPLLHNGDIAAGFERLSAPALLVGGTSDESWDGEVARRAGHEVLELEGANHALQIEGDPLASVDALRVVTARIDEFVSGLEP
jgi:pimeloyl-ACP methyl ester carboxylesterase